MFRGASSPGYAEAERRCKALHDAQEADQAAKAATEQSRDVLRDQEADLISTNERLAEAEDTLRQAKGNTVRIKFCAVQNLGDFLEAIPWDPWVGCNSNKRIAVMLTLTHPSFQGQQLVISAREAGVKAVPTKGGFVGQWPTYLEVLSIAELSQRVHDIRTEATEMKAAVSAAQRRVASDEGAERSAAAALAQALRGVSSAADSLTADESVVSERPSPRPKPNASHSNDKTAAAAGAEKTTAMKVAAATTSDANTPATPPDAQQRPATVSAPADVATPPADAQKTADGLYSRVLEKGDGTVHPEPTDVVRVDYTGWTTDGKMFDSSVVRGRPAEFPLNRVIPGWTEGVQLMVKGEKRRFWIPEQLAYKGRPGAPQGMLVFDVRLLGIVGSNGRALANGRGAQVAGSAPAEQPAKTGNGAVAFVAVEGASVREAPEMTSRIIARLSRGAQVQLLGANSEDATTVAVGCRPSRAHWKYVRDAKDDVGWVHGALLTAVKPADVPDWRAVVPFSPERGGTEDWGYYGIQAIEACEHEGGFGAFVDGPDKCIPIGPAGQPFITLDGRRLRRSFGQGWLLFARGKPPRFLKYDPENLQQVTEFCAGTR